MDKITKKNLKRSENINKITKLFELAVVKRVDISAFKDELKKPACIDCYVYLLRLCVESIRMCGGEEEEEEEKEVALEHYSTNFHDFNLCIEKCHKSPRDKTQLKYHMKALLEEHLDLLIEMNSYFTFKTYNM